jgi:hypothetical protein
MKRSATRRLLALALALGGLLAASASAQGADPSQDAQKMGSPMALPDGATVESMWPAPAAADWERPVLVHWQRTLEDALRVAGESQRPVLVCVNMDGEPASEHYAGIRYRSEESARLLEPYVCVIASVYRHTPRDHDENGRRIPCPRFGGVTCGEHIAIEPVLYEKYFEGQRIAPRHILLEADGREGYDVFYSWDTASVFHAWREGVKDRPPRPEVKDDLPLPARAASADSDDRVVLERAYLEGTREARRELLTATMKAREVDQVELLRLALFGLDMELARLARQALARCDSEAAVDLIAEALKAPMAEGERAQLVAAAERLAAKYPRAGTLVAVQRGLASPSRFIDVTAWAGADTAAARYQAAARLGAELEGHARAAESSPADGPARLAYAEALLVRAQDPATERRFAELLLADAHAAGTQAETLGVRGWRLDALLAVTSAARGERAPAVARALAAVEGGMPRPGSADSPQAEASGVAVLALFAEARQQAIARAYRERKPWPPEWLADVHAAYAVLLAHPLGTDQHAADAHDFLRWLGAGPRADEALDRGLARFPESWRLHERLRARLLLDKGPDGLEAEYAARLAKPDAAPALEWFAGYASLVAAEAHRRAGERPQALAAYERALARYEHDRAARPDHALSVDHYAAMALAGRAQVLFEQGELELATRAWLAAFTRAPDAAASFDGLGMSAIDGARQLLARLEREQQSDLAAALQAGLTALGPERLDRPDLQRGVPNEAARAGDRRRPRGEGR